MHKSYTILDIAAIVSAETKIIQDRCVIKSLVYDSRKISAPAHSLFFALKGLKDGHLFVHAAYQAGVRNFVVIKQQVDFGNYPEANFLFVENPLQSLQALAQYHRAQFDYPVIAITGSNGKTVVKEWLNQLLASDFNIVRSPKSYNSQLGVAISLWEMTSENNLAIIEAGISRVGEMERLQQMIQPTVGVLTNIGSAHDKGFKSQEEKVNEKLRLFRDISLLIYSPQYALDQPIPTGRQFRWGYQPAFELAVIKKEITGISTIITAVYKGREEFIEIPFQDEASIENAITCWSVLLSMNYEHNIIRSRMKELLPVEMRLQLKNGINNSSIIDDSYSCDISSLIIALNFLQSQNQHGRRVLILSDIPEIGNNKKSGYQRVADLLKINSIDLFIGIGKEISDFSSLVKTPSLFFDSTNAFIQALSTIDLANSTILLKGARSFSFENISRVLTLKTHDTSLEINLNALENNLKHYKSRLDPETKLMVMVKAFSYGSGSFEIANLLEFNQVDYLAVAYTDEGITLRKSGINLPIMVMSPAVSSFEAIIDNRLEPEIFSIENLMSFLTLLETRNISGYPIHIKLETGMNRLGFDRETFDSLCKVLADCSAVRVSSIFSHLAASDSSAHDYFTLNQINKLQEYKMIMQEVLPYPFLTHISNTAAIQRWPQARFDMVRLGIGLYGIGLSPEGEQLEVVAALKTTIAQLKDVTGQDTIGYNRKGVLPNGGTIATIKIGYADGYNRRFGNGNGSILVQGKLVPTVGDICMDMCMIDVTGMPVSVGDEVVVFGKEPRIESLAKSIETIPYEIMTSISQRVKRIYYYE